MRLEHSFVQREDATAHLSHLETGQGLAVDFHPAVKHIDLGEQLALRTDGLHCSAEFRLSVMGKNHVLQQNGLVPVVRPAAAASAFPLREESEFPAWAVELPASVFPVRQAFAAAAG